MLLIAAGLHAGWNLILKQVGEKYIVNWWSVLSSAVLLSPLVFIYGFPERSVWPILIASAAVEALYMAVLASAYRLGDFSLIYPIARGTAPAFIALWATMFLGEQITPLGASGLALVVVGLVVIGSSGLFENRQYQSHGSSNTSPDAAARPWLARNLAGISLALTTALLISIYSTLDAAAVRQTSATPYTITMLGIAGIFFTPFALAGNGWKKTAAVGKQYWWAILAIGFAGMLAYILVVNAYAIAQVSYASAIREISVVFGAIAGWRLLGESFGLPRVIGALLLFCGVILIAMA